MTPAEPPPLPYTPDYCVVARQNDSLEHRRRWTAFALVASVSLVIAAAFVAVGAWPVLPYSALEIGLLAGAFVIVERRARNWERLSVAGDRVVVETVCGGQATRREFNRQWLRVELEGDGALREPWLTLRFAGERVKFGEALPPGRRIEVARTLARLTAAR